MSTTQYYFAYGANMSFYSMRARCPLAMPIQKFSLRNWRLNFGHHATIVREPGAVCEGALWMITEHCERSLDAFEGYPDYYDKMFLEQDGVKFMAYEMVDLDLRDMPSGSYIELLREGYRDWNLNEDLLDQALDFDLKWNN